MPAMTAAPNILVFDSGLGGLTVFREVVSARPDARFVYAADDAFFPYGRQDEAELVERVLEVMGDLIAAHRPDLVVSRATPPRPWCCAQLRARNSKCRSSAPFPRSSRRARASNSKLVSVLGTEATVKREYTRELVRRARKQLRRNAGRLAAARRDGRGRIERRALRPTRTSPPRLAPCFVMPAIGAPTPSCSPARIIRCCCSGLNSFRPGRCRFIDPAPAIARRVVDLLGPVIRQCRAAAGTGDFHLGQGALNRRSPRRWPVSASAAGV